MSLKEIGGWSSMKMVERYAHLASGYKGMMMDKLSGKFIDCHPIATSTDIQKFRGKKETSQNVEFTRLTTVSQGGIEPPTNGLKGRCSTT